MSCAPATACVGVPAGDVEVPGSVGGVREEGLRPRVVRTAGPGDVLPDVVPLSGLHGRPGQAQGQLDVVGTGRLVEHRPRQLQGLAGPAVQAEQPGPFRGSRGAPEAGAVEVVEEPLRGQQAAPGQLASRQREQQLRDGIERAGPEQQVGGRRDVVRTAAGHERLGRTPRERRDLGREQEGQDGVAGQRVSPPQRAAVDDEQPHPLDRAERLQHVPLGYVGHLVEERPVRVDAEHGRTREHSPLDVREPLEPLLHQAAQGRRHVGDAARSRQALLDQLLDQERQPVGPLVEHAQGGRIGGAQSSGEPAHLRWGQALQPQGGDGGQSSEPGGRRRQRAVVAHRGHDEDGQGHGGDGHVGEDGPRVGVGPLQVLEDQQAGADLPHQTEEPGDRLAEHEPGVDTGLGRRASGGLRPVREQPRRARRRTGRGPRG